MTDHDHDDDGPVQYDQAWLDGAGRAGQHADIVKARNAGHLRDLLATPRTPKEPRR